MQEILEIIYQDQWLVAINKPPGLLVHRTNIDRHESRFAVQLLRDQLGQRVHPLHRLDKPTSGVLLFALDSASARQVSQQFRDQQVHKDYLAVVRGWPQQQGVIDCPLVDGPITAGYGQQRGAAAPRAAVTHYRNLGMAELPVSDGRHATSRYALVEARPTSGRRHQLRRHFKHIFHPIIGDTTYGDGRHNRLFRERFDCQRLLLHAHRLELRHPQSDQRLCIEARLDEDFLAALQGLQILWEEGF